jgi:predicted enzyme related to lactoylglutathione lyase
MTTNPVSWFEIYGQDMDRARIAGAGGKVHRDKMSIRPYGFVLLGVDTEGNVFGLHSMR